MSPSEIETRVEAVEVERETQGEVTAYFGDVLVGELRFVDYAGTCQIRNLFVVPDFRREGVATTLIARLREYLPASVPAQFLMTADAKALRDAIFDEYRMPVA